MAKENIAEIFTNQDKKTLNDARHVMENIYSKLAMNNYITGSDKDVASFIEYLEHCLYDGISAIEDIEAQINNI